MSGKERWFRGILLGSGILCLLLLAPMPWILKGYRLARHADDHGIEILIGLDGGGASLRASPRCLRGEVPFDNALYAGIAGSPRTFFPEGPLGCLYGIGTHLYHRVPLWGSRDPNEERKEEEDQRRRKDLMRARPSP